jgi:hypothetical protein
MQAEIQKDIHFILGLIAGLCQFENRNEFMLAALVEDLQAQEEIAALLEDIQAQEEIAAKTNRGTRNGSCA